MSRAQPTGTRGARPSRALLNSRAGQSEFLRGVDRHGVCAIVARRQYGKTTIFAKLALKKMMKTAGHTVIFGSAKLNLSREIVRKEAEVLQQAIGALIEDADEGEVRVADGDTGKVPDRLLPDDFADLFEAQRLEFRFYHSRTVYSRTKVVALRPDTVGETGDLMSDEVGRVQNWSEVCEAIEPIVQSNPDFRWTMSTTPPPDDTHYSFEQLAPPVGVEFKVNPKGNWYRSDHGIWVLRVDAYDAYADGVNVYDLESRKPLHPDEHRKRAHDKDAWDRNYGVKFVVGGTAAVGLLQLNGAQARGMGKCACILIEDNDELERAAAWLSTHLGPGKVGVGWDVATTEKEISNPSSLSFVEERGNELLVPLIAVWKTRDPDIARERAYRLLAAVEERKEGGRARRMCIDATNERYFATEIWLSTQAKIGVDANPIACVGEWLQHPRFGLGVSTEKINTSKMIASAETLFDEQVGLSPLIVRAQEARAWMTHLLEYIDGFPDVDAGTLAIGLNRQPPAVDLLPMVNEAAMTRRPEITPEDWGATYNQTHLVFTNPALDWNDDPVTWRDRGNFQVTGEFSQLRLDRPWVTNNVLATRMVKAAGRAASLPKCSGQLFLRRTATLFDALTPGAAFRLTFAPRGHRDLVCRVQERSIGSPAAAEFSVSFKLDRSYLNIVAVDGVVQEQNPPPTAETLQLVNAIVVELPLALCPEGQLSLAVIAARPDALTTSYKVHLGESYDFTGAIVPTSYEVLETHNRFAAHGILQADYPSTSEEIDFVGLIVKLDGVDLSLEEQSPFDGLADDVLVFVGDEVMSVHEVVLVDADTYRLRVIRGRFATARQSHVAGAHVYVINRTDVQALQHPQFDVNNEVHFKLQASTGTQLADLGEALVKTMTIAGAIYKSTPPKNLRVNGNSENPSYTTGASPLIQWTLSEAGRDHFQAGLLKVTTVLEFLNGALVVVGAQSIAGGIGSFQPSNAELIALLGGSEISFTIRAKTHTIGDWFEVSSSSITLFVQKV